MADVRALLAAEKSSRRISHPHATYTKSGVLSCKACNLSIKSEALWEGHLKSANHRKNAAKATAAQLNSEYSVPSAQRQQSTTGGAATASSSSSSSSTVVTTTRNLKRKLEDVEESNPQQIDRDYEVDGRKKPRSRVASTTLEQEVVESSRPILSAHSQSGKTQSGNRNGTSKHVRFSPSITAGDVNNETDTLQNGGIDADTVMQTTQDNGQTLDDVQQQDQQDPQSAAPAARQEQKSMQIQETAIDEDEWAAFESEITSLEQQSASTNTISFTKMTPNLSGAVIEAAPITSTQIAQQEEETRQQKQKLALLDKEIDDEKEEESRRIEEEFEIMEEMEGKVRRLREMRERLRLPLTSTEDATVSSLQTDTSSSVAAADGLPETKDGVTETDGKEHDESASSQDHLENNGIELEDVQEKKAVVGDGEDNDSSSDDEDDWYA